VYARVLAAHRDMDPELDCTTQSDTDVLGQLSGGYLFTVSLNLASTLLTADPTILAILSDKFSYEIAIGMNGRVWIDAKTPRDMITIATCIVKSEFIYGKEANSMVKGVIRAMNEE